MPAVRPLSLLAVGALLASCADPVQPRHPTLTTDPRTAILQDIAAVLEIAIDDSAASNVLRHAMLASEYAGAELDLTDLAANNDFVRIVATTARREPRELARGLQALADYQLSLRPASLLREASLPLNADLIVTSIADVQLTRDEGGTATNATVIPAFPPHAAFHLGPREVFIKSRHSHPNYGDAIHIRTAGPNAAGQIVGSNRVAHLEHVADASGRVRTQLICDDSMLQCGGGGGGEMTYAQFVGVAGMCDLTPVASPFCTNTNEIEWRSGVYSNNVLTYSAMTRVEGMPTHTYWPAFGIISHYLMGIPLVPFRPRFSTATEIRVDVVETDGIGPDDQFGSFVLREGGASSFGGGPFRCTYYPGIVTFVPACPLFLWHVWQADYSWTG